MEANTELLLVWFMVGIIAILCFVFMGLGLYFCSGRCPCRERAQRNQREEGLVTPGNSDTTGRSNEGPSQPANADASNSRRSTKTVKLPLPNCTVFRYSNRFLPSLFGRSSRWKNEACSICLDHYIHGDYIAVCPCKHGYHPSCLSEWLHVRNNCPLCKRPVRNGPNERTPLLFVTI